jgi:hypothetical protein
VVSGVSSSIYSEHKCTAEQPEMLSTPWPSRTKSLLDDPIFHRQHLAWPTWLLTSLSSCRETSDATRESLRTPCTAREQVTYAPTAADAATNVDSTSKMSKCRKTHTEYKGATSSLILARPIHRLIGENESLEKHSSRTPCGLDQLDTARQAQLTLPVSA